MLARAVEIAVQDDRDQLSGYSEFVVRILVVKIRILEPDV